MSENNQKNSNNAISFAFGAASGLISPIASFSLAAVFGGAAYVSGAGTVLSVVAGGIGLVSGFLASDVALSATCDYATKQKTNLTANFTGFLVGALTCLGATYGVDNFFNDEEAKTLEAPIAIEQKLDI